MSQDHLNSSVSYPAYESQLANSSADFKLGRVLDALPHIAWVTARDTDEMLYINSRWEEYTGVNGMHRDRIVECIHPDDLASVVRHMELSRSTGKPHPYVVRLRCKEGQFRWFRVHPSPLFDEVGELEGWIGTTIDIHEEEIVRQSLRATEERTRLALEGARLGTWEIDIKTNEVFVTSEVGQLFNQPSTIVNQSIGSWLAAIHPEDRQSAAETLNRLFDDGLPFDDEFRVVKEDGTICWLHSRASLFRDPAGAPWKAVGVVSDVSERKQEQEAFERAREALGLAMRAAKMGWWSRNLITEVVTWSPELEEIFGLEVGTFAGSRGQFLDFVHEEDRAILSNAVQKATETYEDFFVDFRFQKADGSAGLMEARGKVMCDQSGKPIASYGIGIDVTERRRSEEMLRLTTDAAPVFIAYLDADLRYRFCNSAYEEQFGIPKEEILGQFIGDVLGTHVYSQVEPHIMRALRGKDANFAAWLDYDQVGRRYIRGSYRPRFDHNGKVIGIFVLVADHTAERRSEEALFESELRLRRILDASTVGVLINREDGLLTYANDQFLNMLGFSRDELERGELTWSRIESPELAEKNASALAQLRKDNVCDPYETYLVKKNGELLPVFVGAVLVPNEKGDGQLGAAFVTNLTDIKKVELQLRHLNTELDDRVQERTSELKAANKELEGFTYHISHDLRAPLRAIVSTSRILEEDYAGLLPPEALELLERQASAANKLGRLIDDLLKLSRLSKEQLKKVPVDFSVEAEEAWQEALSMHPESKAMIEIQPNLTVAADQRLLKLVLVNLIENAVKYSPEGGKVSVGLGDNGVFYVADQGIGIARQYLDKIFEPFQRLHTDADYQGTGIGLANVQQIVEKHGGRVWAESVVGTGSTFYFTI